MPDTTYDLLKEIAAIITIGATAITAIVKAFQWLKQQQDLKKTQAKENSVGETAIKRIEGKLDEFQRRTEMEHVKIQNSIENLQRSDNELNGDFKDLNKLFLEFLRNK